MASVSAMSCRCKNTCNRRVKRGACPCRTAGKPCTDLCSCGWNVPCINKETPKQPDLFLCPNDSVVDLATEELQESDLIDSEDEWQPVPPPVRVPVYFQSGQKRKKTTNRGRTAKKRPQVDVDMPEIDVTTPVISRTDPTFNAVHVRRRLAVDLASNHVGVTSATDTPVRRKVARRKTSTPHHGTANTEQPLVQRHQQAVKEFAATLNEEGLRSIVVELLNRDQAAFQDYVLGYRPGQPVPPSPPPQPASPPWCRCGFCRPMPTQAEQKCCWTRGSSCCVTHAPNFYTVVTPAILDLAIAHYNDFMVHDQERNNAAYRHQAYRQFTLQRFGRLGAGNRRVVPSCVVLAVRERFPDPEGHYTGFIGN